MTSQVPPGTEEKVAAGYRPTAHCRAQQWVLRGSGPLYSLCVRMSILSVATGVVVAGAWSVTSAPWGCWEPMSHVCAISLHKLWRLPYTPFDCITTRRSTTLVALVRHHCIRREFPRDGAVFLVPVTLTHTDLRRTQENSRTYLSVCQASQPSTTDQPGHSGHKLRGTLGLSTVTANPGRLMSGSRCTLHR